MTKRTILIAGMLTLALGSCASAVPITFRFEGRLWGPEIPSTYLDPPVPVGADFTGTYTFDPQHAEPGFPHELVFTGPPHGLVLQLGPHRFATDALRIRIENDAFNGDYDRHVVRAEVYDESGIQGFETTDIVLLSIDWGLTDTTASALTDASLPINPLNLDQWNLNFFHVSGWRQPNLQLLDAFNIYGQVNSLVLVPEPDSAILALVGLTVLAGYILNSENPVD